MPTLEIDQADSRLMARQLRRAGRREIGGILMAEQVGPGRFHLAAFTTDDHAGTRSTFRRSEAQHTAALNEFFSRHQHDFARFNYFGEWHSHPSFPVTPSELDKRTMRDIVAAPGGPDFAVLVIARLDYWIRLRLSATVFQLGYPDYDMDIAIVDQPRRGARNGRP